MNSGTFIDWYNLLDADAGDDGDDKIDGDDSVDDKGDRTHANTSSSIRIRRRRSCFDGRTSLEDNELLAFRLCLFFFFLLFVLPAPPFFFSLILLPVFIVDDGDCMMPAVKTCQVVVL